MSQMLEKDLTSLAFCWRLERRDGICLGFTSHDRDLIVHDLHYRASPGMLPSAVRLTDGFESGSLDVAGALTSDSITADDLAGGRWDGAGVSLFVVDWEDPGGGQVALARGELGDVSVGGSSFEAELRGPAARLERPVVEQTSPECRAELGDRRCRVGMAGRTRIARVAGAPTEDQVTVEDPEPSAGAYAFGRLRWLTGSNSGLESGIQASSGTLLTLRDPPPRASAAGDLVELREGCDKLFSTCTGRFGNAANFRGEPHLPGMDLLTRYPGAS